MQHSFLIDQPPQSTEHVLLLCVGETRALSYIKEQLHPGGRLVHVLAAGSAGAREPPLNL